MIKFDLDGRTSISSDDKGCLMISYTKNGSPPAFFHLNVAENALFVFTENEYQAWQDGKVILHPSVRQEEVIPVEVKADDTVPQKFEPTVSNRKGVQKGYSRLLRRYLTQDESKLKAEGWPFPYDGTGERKIKNKNGWGGKRIRRVQPESPSANSPSDDKGSSSEPDVPGEEITSQPRAPGIIPKSKTVVLLSKQSITPEIPPGFFVLEKGDAPKKINPKLFIRIDDTGLIAGAKAPLKKVGLKYVGDIIYFDIGKLSDLIQSSKLLVDLKEYIEGELKLKFHSREPYWRPSNVEKKSYELFPKDCDIDDQLYVLGCLGYNSFMN